MTALGPQRRAPSLHRAEARQRSHGGDRNTRINSARDRRPTVGAVVRLRRRPRGGTKPAMRRSSSSTRITPCPIGVSTDPGAGQQYWDDADPRAGRLDQDLVIGPLENVSARSGASVQTDPALRELASALRELSRGARRRHSCSWTAAPGRAETPGLTWSDHGSSCRGRHPRRAAGSPPSS
jgi:hypothetical protein